MWQVATVLEHMHIKHFPSLQEILLDNAAQNWNNLYPFLVWHLQNCRHDNAFYLRDFPILCLILSTSRKGPKGKEPRVDFQVNEWVTFHFPEQYFSESGSNMIITLINWNSYLNVRFLGPILKPLNLPFASAFSVIVMECWSLRTIVEKSNLDGSSVTLTESLRCGN